MRVCGIFPYFFPYAVTIIRTYWYLMQKSGIQLGNNDTKSGILTTYGIIPCNSNPSSSAIWNNHSNPNTHVLDDYGCFYFCIANSGFFKPHFSLFSWTPISELRKTRAETQKNVRFEHPCLRSKLCKIIAALAYFCSAFFSVQTSPKLFEILHFL